MPKVRVLLADGRAVGRDRLAGAVLVRDATGVETGLPAGQVPLKPDLQVFVDGTPVTLTGPLAFVPGKGGR